MRQPYRWLFIGLALGGVAAAAGAVLMLFVANGVNVGAEVGKWLLTVAAGLLISGALSIVVKQIDQRRVERDAWHTVLNDLVAANQTVMLVRLRLAAHRSALTYREQLAEVMRARVELRRLCAIGNVIADPPLREGIEVMRGYLDDLGSEYETGYLRVARQQRLDELWLTKQVTVAADSAEAPVLPELLAEPTTAWRQLQDWDRFPRLAAILDTDTFRIDAFRANYKIAKSRLEEHAGIGRRSLTARMDSAERLSKRTRTFMSRHPALPRDIVTAMLQRIADLDSARSAADPATINIATVQLNDVTRQAIKTVYP